MKLSSIIPLEIIIKRNRFLVKLFKNKINETFLEETLKLVEGNLTPKLLSNIYKAPKDKFSLTPNESSLPDFEICKLIVGVHHFNTLLKNDEDISKLCADKEYKHYIVKEVLNMLIFRPYSIERMRIRSLANEEDYCYFPCLYYSIVMLFRVGEIMAKSNQSYDKPIKRIVSLLKSIFTLIEANDFVTSLATCRKLIESFFKYEILRVNNKALELYKKIQDYFSNGINSEYFNEIDTTFKSIDRRISKDKYCDFGFVDAIENYFKIVENNSLYTIYGVAEYLEKVDLENEDLYKNFIDFYNYGNRFVHPNFYDESYEIDLFTDVTLIFSQMVQFYYDRVLKFMELKLEKIDEHIKKLFGDNFSKFEDLYVSSKINEDQKEQFQLRVKKGLNY